MRHMNQPDHPDILNNHSQIKSITRGGMQAIEDKAIEAMWRGLERGATREEVERIFFSLFKKTTYGH